MILEGLLGLTMIVLVTLFVAKFVLEVSHMPVMSDEEWDLAMEKYMEKHIERKRR